MGWISIAIEVGEKLCPSLTGIEYRADQVHIILVGRVVNAVVTKEVQDVINIPVAIYNGCILERLILQGQQPRVGLVLFRPKVGIPRRHGASTGNPDTSPLSCVCNSISYLA
jgi:hypothetical protein